MLIGCGSDPLAEKIAELKNRSVEIRRAAARALSDEPSADERAVAALADAAQDADAEVRRLSLYALGKCGRSAKSSSPAVKRALEDSEPSVRVRAALTMQRIDPESQDGVPILIEAIRRGDGRVLLEIGALGPDAAWAAPTLTRLLTHEQPQVRALAAQTLGRLGPAAGDAVPALQRAQRDPNPAVQSAAQAALQRIQPKVAR